MSCAAPVRDPLGIVGEQSEKFVDRTLEVNRRVDGMVEPKPCVPLERTFWLLAFRAKFHPAVVAGHRHAEISAGHLVGLMGRSDHHPDNLLALHPCRRPDAFHFGTVITITVASLASVWLEVRAGENDRLVVPTPRQRHRPHVELSVRLRLLTHLLRKIVENRKTTIPSLLRLSASFGDSVSSFLTSSHCATPYQYSDLLQHILVSLDCQAFNRIIRSGAEELQPLYTMEMQRKIGV